MALPDLRLDPIVRPYVPMDLETFSNTVDQKITDYDLAADAYDALGTEADRFTSTVLPYNSDQKVAQNIVGKYRKLIEDAAARGDYENMTRLAKRHARDFMGEAQPLRDRRDAILKMKEAITNDKELTRSMKQASLARIDQMNDTLDEQGNLLPVKTYNPGKYFDMVDYLNKNISGIKADGKTYITAPDKNGNVRKVDITGLSAKEVQDIAQSFLESSGQFSDYRNTMLELGLSEEFVNEYANAVAGITNKFAFSDINESMSTMNIGDGDSSNPNFSGNILYGNLVPSKGQMAKATTDDIKTFLDTGSVNKGFNEIPYGADVAGNAGIWLYNKVRGWFNEPSTLQEAKQQLFTNYSNAYDEYIRRNPNSPVTREEYIKSQVNSLTPVVREFDDKTRKKVSEYMWDKEANSGALANATIVVPMDDPHGFAPGIEVPATTYFEKALDVNWRDSKDVAAKIPAVTALGTADASMGPRTYLIKFNDTTLYAKFPVANATTDEAAASIVSELYQEAAVKGRAVRQLNANEVRLLSKDPSQYLNEDGSLKQPTYMEMLNGINGQKEINIITE